MATETDIRKVGYVAATAKFMIVLKRCFTGSKQRLAKSKT